MEYHEKRPSIPRGVYWVQTDEGDGWLVPSFAGGVCTPEGAAEEVASRHWSGNDYPERQVFTVFNFEGKFWRVAVAAEVEPVFRGRVLAEG